MKPRMWQGFGFYLKVNGFKLKIKITTYKWIELRGWDIVSKFGYYDLIFADLWHFLYAFKRSWINFSDSWEENRFVIYKCIDLDCDLTTMLETRVIKNSVYDPER